MIALSPASLTWQYHRVVPRSIRANLLFRRWVAENMNDPSFRVSVRSMCEHDPLFYINTFVWCCDPRRKNAVLPFITYPFQDVGVMKIMAAIFCGYDLFIEKSRDMGASLCVITCFDFVWRFVERAGLLLLSRVLDLVDAKDMRALLPRLDFINEHMVRGLRPILPLDRTDCHLGNPDTMSTIDGEATTKHSGAADRRTAMLLDEFARVPNGDQMLSATRDVTNCRIFNSTPQGIGNAFYRLRCTPIEKLRMHWSVHPRKNPGLYASADGRLQILDTKFPFPRDYPFVLDGRLRSPWYDYQRKHRCASDWEAAQELDIDYSASVPRFFDETPNERARLAHARLPRRTGNLILDRTGAALPDFVDGDGPLKFWVDFDITRSPARDRLYAIGADVSMGTGNSNSTLAVADALTGEIVCTYASPRVMPDELARIACALGRWFTGKYNEPARLIWETNGPGGGFTDEVQKQRYPNVYLREIENQRRRRQTELVGFHKQDEETWTRLMIEYRRALYANEIMPRDNDLFDEHREWIYGPTGSPEHAAMRSTQDPSGAGRNHGDRTVAHALVWKAVAAIRRGQMDQCSEVIRQAHTVAGHIRAIERGRAGSLPTSSWRWS